MAQLQAKSGRQLAVLLNEIFDDVGVGVSERENFIARAQSKTGLRFVGTMHSHMTELLAQKRMSVAKQAAEQKVGLDLPMFDKIVDFLSYDSLKSISVLSRQHRERYVSRLLTRIDWLAPSRNNVYTYLMNAGQMAEKYTIQPVSIRLVMGSAEHRLLHWLLSVLDLSKLRKVTLGTLVGPRFISCQYSTLMMNDQHRYICHLPLSETVQAVLASSNCLLACLRVCPDLHQLDVSEKERNGFGDLSELPRTLRKLEIGFNVDLDHNFGRGGLTTERINQFTSVLPNLSHLVLRGGTTRSSFVVQSDSLEVLEVHGLTKSCRPKLIRCPKLKELHVDCTGHFYENGYYYQFVGDQLPATIDLSSYKPKFEEFKRRDVLGFYIVPYSGRMNDRVQATMDIPGDCRIVIYDR
mmetsp:Transcript_15592/g.25997  ORF Transcript_15592/g.25997 Transcript_15592/m.25997 type:complete len:409 (+) Transcript_15592:76-1302(+)